MSTTPDHMLALRLLARHGLLTGDLPDMLGLWPDVHVPTGCPAPKPATLRKHAGERICARCNHWAHVLSYPNDGIVCRTCLELVAVTPVRRRRACRA